MMHVMPIRHVEYLSLFPRENEANLLPSSLPLSMNGETSPFQNGDFNLHVFAPQNESKI